MRRWRVIIEDIEITNQTPNIINPFIKFIVGGDYRIYIKKLKSGNKYLPEGTKGISQFTDKINYLDAGASQHFGNRFEMLYEASYFQLMEEHLHIEVWNSGGFFSLNTFLGYESLRLLDVASGPIQVQRNIYDKIERDGDFKSMKCTLSFKL